MRRLKQIREKTSHQNNDPTGVTDGDKIRLQVNVDVQQYKAIVQSLQVDVNNVHKLNELISMVMNAVKNIDIKWYPQFIDLRLILSYSWMENCDSGIYLCILWVKQMECCSYCKDMSQIIILYNQSFKGLYLRLRLVMKTNAFYNINMYLISWIKIVWFEKIETIHLLFK